MPLWDRKGLNMNCCYECNSRVVGCHSKCKKYEEYLKEHKKLKDMERKTIKKYNDAFYR